MIACSDSEKKPAATAQPGVEEAVGTAVDAYIYGYSLVTMDMTRTEQFTTSRPKTARADGTVLNSLRIRPSITTASPLPTPIPCIHWRGSTFPSHGYSAFPTWEIVTTCSRCRTDGGLFDTPVSAPRAEPTKYLSPDRDGRDGARRHDAIKSRTADGVLGRICHRHSRITRLPMRCRQVLPRSVKLLWQALQTPPAGQPQSG